MKCHCFQTGSAAHSAFNEVKSLERESDFSSLASDKVGNTWSYNPAPQCFVVTSIIRSYGHEYKETVFALLL
jgi:hypothetical protein